MKNPMLCVSAMMLLAVALATQGIAQGACGGGGNAAKSSAPETPITAAVPVRPAATFNAPDAYAERGNVSAQNVSANRFDTASFDRISPSLNLSAGQHKDIEKSRARISSKNDSLLGDYETAQADLAKCNGRCEKQSKKLSNASQELQAFDPNQDFADRLSHILSHDQFERYQSSVQTRKSRI